MKTLKAAVLTLGAAFVATAFFAPPIEAAERKIFPFTREGGAGLTRSLSGPADVVSRAIEYARENPDQETSVSLSIEFEFDSTALTSSARDDLDFLSDLITRATDDEVLFVVEGHTDSKGSERYNMKLSIKRAFAARAYLIDKGVEAERLIAVGYGEKRHLPDVTPTHDANRRVEFLVEFP